MQVNSIADYKHLRLNNNNQMRLYYNNRSVKSSSMECLGFRLASLDPIHCHKRKKKSIFCFFLNGKYQLLHLV